MDTKWQSSKKCLLLLHGWGCTKEIFTPYIQLFENIYNIICFDMYGFGQSDSPKPFFDIYEYATQIYIYLKSKKVNEIDVIAHSFGGRVVTILSSMFDIKINKLILSGSAGLKPKRSIVYYLKIYKYKLLKKLHISSNNNGSEDYRQLSANMQKVFVKVVNQHLDYLLPCMNNNIMLIWGTNDSATPIYMCRKYEKYLSKVKSVVIPKAEHFVIFSHIYICNNIIKEFLVYD